MLLRVAAGLLSATVVLPFIDLVLERVANPLAKAIQFAKDVAEHPDIKKHLSKAARK